MAWQDCRSVSTLTINLYHLRQYSRWIGRLLEATATSHGKITGRRSIGAAASLDGFQAVEMVGLPHAAEVRQALSLGF